MILLQYQNNRSYMIYSFLKIIILFIRLYSHNQVHLDKQEDIKFFIYP
jgi:hypothetical protein